MKAAVRTMPATINSLSRPLPPLPRPAWLPQTEWPYETKALEVAGVTVAVTDVGEGPTLLFVHTGFWSFVWRDLMARLAHDFRCVTFDAPGTGLSTRIPNVTLRGASDVVTSLIEKLDLSELTLV